MPVLLRSLTPSPSSDFVSYVPLWSRPRLVVAAAQVRGDAASLEAWASPDRDFAPLRLSPRCASWCFSSFLNDRLCCMESHSSHSAGPILIKELCFVPRVGLKRMLCGFGFLGRALSLSSQMYFTVQLTGEMNQCPAATAFRQHQSLLCSGWSPRLLVMW